MLVSLDRVEFWPSALSPSSGWKFDRRSSVENAFIIFYGVGGEEERGWPSTVRALRLG